MKKYLRTILLCALCFTLSSCGDVEDTIKEDVTAYMDEGDYQAAIEELEKWWDDFSLANDPELVELYVQCYEAKGEYKNAANVIISIFENQGYEDALDGELHTRLGVILPQLSKEELSEVEAALSAIPDSLEEKEKLEEEAKKKAEAEKKAAEEAKKAAEPSNEEKIASNLYKTMYPVMLVFEYEENLLFRKGVELDVFIDGEEIAELKQGTTPAYGIILSAGTHKLKVASSFINSDSIEFTVGEDPYLGAVENYAVAQLAFKNGDATISALYTNRDAVSADDAVMAWGMVQEMAGTNYISLNNYNKIMELHYEKFAN